MTFGLRVGYDEIPRWHAAQTKGSQIERFLSFERHVRVMSRAKTVHEDRPSVRSPEFVSGRNRGLRLCRGQRVMRTS
jgi:hypothetical protein